MVKLFGIVIQKLANLTPESNSRLKRIRTLLQSPVRNILGVVVSVVDRMEAAAVVVVVVVVAAAAVVATVVVVTAVVVGARCCIANESLLPANRNCRMCPETKTM